MICFCYIPTFQPYLGEHVVGNTSKVKLHRRAQGSFTALLCPSGHGEAAAGKVTGVGSGHTPRVWPEVHVTMYCVCM